MFDVRFNGSFNGGPSNEYLILIPPFYLPLLSKAPSPSPTGGPSTEVLSVGWLAGIVKLALGPSGLPAEKMQVLFFLHFEAIESCVLSFFDLRHYERRNEKARSERRGVKGGHISVPALPPLYEQSCLA
jgi:hypothetical protein